MILWVALKRHFVIALHFLDMRTGLSQWGTTAGFRARQNQLVLEMLSLFLGVVLHTPGTPWLIYGRYQSSSNPSTLRLLFMSFMRFNKITLNSITLSFSHRRFYLFICIWNCNLVCSISLFVIWVWIKAQRQNTILAHLAPENEIVIWLDG